MRFDSSDNPTATAANQSIAAATIPHRIGVDGTDVSVFYRSSADSDIYAIKSTDDGATFGAPVLVFAGTVASADANVSRNTTGGMYQRGNQILVGYVVNDNAVLKYNEYLVRTLDTGQRYWRGGTADWDATAGSKWADTVGGAAGASIPNATHDVFFDATSGSGTITVTATSTIKSANFTGFTGTLTGSGAQSIASVGNITLSSGMTLTTGPAWAFSGTGPKTITCNGKSFPTGVNFNAAATYTLADHFSCAGQASFSAGTFNANDKNVTAGGSLIFSGASTVVNMGAGVWTTSNIATAWSMAAGVTVNCDTSTIRFTNNSPSAKVFGGADKTYYNFENATGNVGALEITGSNTFNVLDIASVNSGRTFRFTAGTTTTVNDLKASAGTGHVLTSPTSAQHTLTKPSGTVTLNNTTISWSNAIGGATWAIGSGSVNGGNNNGWFIENGKRYWVGGSAAWNATAGTKWATASGGAGGVPKPTVLTDVYFDAASGSVTVTGGGDCKNLDCTGFTGTLNAGDLLVYGNLKVSSAMSFNFGRLFFYGDTVTADFAGKTISDPFAEIHYEGLSTLTFLSSVSAYSLTDTAGVIDLNDQNVTFAGIDIYEGMNLGNGVITVTEWWGAYSSLNAEGSTIRIARTDAAGAEFQFVGGGNDYNIVENVSTSTLYDVQIFDSSSFAVFDIAAPGAANNRVVKFEESGSNTVGELRQSVGTGHALTSTTTANQFILIDTSGLNNLPDTTVSWSNGAGGAVWRYGTDGGNNTGWLPQQVGPAEGTGALAAQSATTPTSNGKSESIGTAALVAVTPTRTNLAPRSEEFDNAAWSKFGAAIQANSAFSPDFDFTFTADILKTPDATNEAHRIIEPVAVIPFSEYTFSVYAKSGATSWVQLAYDGVSQNYNLATGALGNYTGICSATITPAGNNWYRCTLTRTLSGVSTTYPNVVLIQDDTVANTPPFSNASCNINIWGAQFEAGATATAYIKTLDTAVSVGSPIVGTGIARWNATGALVAGISRTNILNWSQQLENWNKSNTTVTANATSAPDGTLTAERITDDGLNAHHFITTGLSQAGFTGRQVTLSIYAQANTLTWLQLNCNSAPACSANFNLSSGAIGQTTGTVTPAITYVGDGWYRCSITFVSGVSAPLVYYILKDGDIAGLTATYVGTGQSLYLWGAQLETAAAPTAYIPSGSSYATVVDGATVSGAGTVTSPPATGTGVLASDISAIAGAGLSDSIGTAAGTASDIVITSAGISSSNDTSSALVNAQAAVAGTNVVQLRPDSDIALDGWTDHTDGTTNIYQTLDEPSVSDLDYVQSPSVAGGGGDTTITIGPAAAAAFYYGFPGYTKLSQSFTSTGNTVELFKVWMGTSNFPSDNIVAKLHTADVNHYPATLIATSNSVPGNSLPANPASAGDYAECTFTFTGVSVSPGTEYCIVLERSGSITYSSYYFIKANDAAPAYYTGGILASFNNVSWSVPASVLNWDLSCVIEQANVLAIGSFAATDPVLWGNVGGSFNILAQEFIAAGTSITKVRHKIARNGSPTDGITCKIFTAAATTNHPNTQVGVTSGVVASGSLPVQPTYGTAEFIFATPVPVTPGTVYNFVIERTGALEDGNNYASIYGFEAYSGGCVHNYSTQFGQWYVTSYLDLVSEVVQKGGAAAAATSLKVRLFDGATQIAEWTHTDVTETFATAEQTLTAPQARGDHELRKPVCRTRRRQRQRLPLRAR